MVKHRYNPLLLLFLLFAFLLTGCSHQSNRPSLVTETGSLLDQNKKIEAAETKQTPPAQVEPEEVIGDDTDADFDDDELDMFEDEMKENLVAVYDPLAPFNRVMFQFNDKLYHLVLKPIAWTYKTIIPWEIRLSVTNFFDNIRAPVRLVNCILQGKGREAVVVFGRFFINTTAGFLGLGNPAATLPNLNGGDEDLGQTLAVYGIGDGPYVVLPVLGPFTLRDAVGYVGDWFFHPLFYLDSLEATLGSFGLKLVNDTSYRIGDYEALKKASIDPYVAVREIYLQYRRKKIKE